MSSMASGRAPCCADAREIAPKHALAAASAGMSKREFTCVLDARGKEGARPDSTYVSSHRQAQQPPVRTQRYACCLWNQRGIHPFSGTPTMLWTLAVILFILWILGFGVFHVAGGMIHLLLVIAIVVVLIRLITGRRPVV